MKRPALNGGNPNMRLGPRGEEFHIKQAQIIEKLLVPKNQYKDVKVSHNGSFLQPVYGGNDTTESDESTRSLYLGPANV
jgi:hypothetical protein